MYLHFTVNDMFICHNTVWGIMFFFLKDVLTCSSFEQHEHQQTAGIIEKQKFETWTIWKFQRAYNRNPILRLQWKMDNLNRYFLCKNRGFHPSFVPVLSPGRRGCPGGGQGLQTPTMNATDGENSGFIPETDSENTWQKTRLLFLVLGPVHSTENDCQHWTNTNANAVKNGIST